jgi:molecular chaperone GrpE
MALHRYDNEHNLPVQADAMTEIELLRKNLHDERNQHQRTLTDFQNYRRRIESERNKLSEDGKREIILSLLDVIDDLEKALQWAGNGEQALTKGVGNILQKLLALLETLKVLPFESEGTLFNHDHHEAVCMAKLKNVKQGIVIKELRRGYLWKDKLLRPAQVRVTG